jgi:hypothetical protein
MGRGDRAARLSTVLPEEGHRDDGVRAGRRQRRDGDRVDHATVGQEPTVEQHRSDEAGQRDGRPDGDLHGALLEPDLPAGEQVGGHGRVGHGQVLDAYAVQQLAHPCHHLVASDQPPRVQRRVEQPEHVALGQLGRPLGVLREPSRGVQPAHQCPHGRAGHRHDLAAVLLQRLDHPDVGVAAGSPAPEGQADARRCCHPSMLGRHRRRPPGSKGPDRPESGPSRWPSPAPCDVRGGRCRARRRRAGRCGCGPPGCGSRRSGAAPGWRGSPGRSRSAASTARPRRPR